MCDFLLPFALLRNSLSGLVEKIEHSYPKSFGNDFQRIQRRVCSPVLDSAEVGLVEAALLPEHDLTQPCLLSQGADHFSKMLAKGLLHGQNYLGYALIHINTNSYI